MLPGVELRDGRVRSPTAGSSHAGQPCGTMKMLPAYIVDKLKFYDRQGEESKTTERTCSTPAT